MMDPISEVPALLEETETLQKNSKTDFSLADANDLLRKYDSVLQRILIWEEGLRKPMDTPLYWATSSSLSHPAESPTSEKLFPLVLEFRSLNVAILVIFTRSVTLQIYSDVLSIHSLIESNSSHAQRSPQSTHSPSKDKSFYKTEADRLARFICQSFEYFHRVDMAMLGPQGTTFSKWLVKKYFRENLGHERELTWCLEFKNMKGPGFRCDVEMMAFTDGVSV
jgi:hypothetical protein